MVGKWVTNIEEIGAYIKGPTKLRHSVMNIFTPLGVYGLVRYFKKQFVD